MFCGDGGGCNKKMKKRVGKRVKKKIPVDGPLLRIMGRYRYQGVTGDSDRFHFHSCKPEAWIYIYTRGC